jgi:V8-like Glu-specific endopeptidase
VKRWLLAAAAVLGVASCSPPGTERVGATWSAITNGTPDSSDGAVVAVITADGGPHCSGTLIGPHTVITAAHCGVDPTSFPQFAVFFGASLGQAGPTLTISDARLDPAFDATTLDHDLALLTLREAAPVAPIALDTGTLDASFVGQSVSVVGYGVTSATAADEGSRHVGQARVSAVASLDFTVLPAPSQPCEGDSGGAALQTSGGASTLVGVVSQGDDACVDHADFARVDVERTTFIDPYLASTAPGTAQVGQKCLYDTQCKSGPCLQTTDAPGLWFCGGSCTKSSDCPTRMTCDGGACRYPLPSPGAPGWSCTQDGDCEAGGACIRDPRSNAQVCSVRCNPAQPTCASGFECQSTSSVDFYCLESPTTPAGSAACAAAPRALGDAPALSTAVTVLLLLARRRSPSATVRAGCRD